MHLRRRFPQFVNDQCKSVIKNSNNSVDIHLHKTEQKFATSIRSRNRNICLKIWEYDVLNRHGYVYRPEKRIYMLSIHPNVCQPYSIWATCFKFRTIDFKERKIALSRVHFWSHQHRTNLLVWYTLITGVNRAHLIMPLSDALLTTAIFL